MGLGHLFPSLLSLSEGPWHLWRQRPLDVASATHCPMASLPGPAVHLQTLWTLAPRPSLATFCFLLLVTLTPSDAGNWVQREEEMALFLLLLFPWSPKARQEWGVRKVPSLLKEVLEMSWKMQLRPDAAIGLVCVALMGFLKSESS